MELNIYQVDAFADKLFAGNPAVVCPLNEFLPEQMMQAIAAENNVSETAFFVKEGLSYRIRWFTPRNEVALCGHATLATAYIIFNFLDKETSEIEFQSKSGKLIVLKLEDGKIQLDFPAKEAVKTTLVPELASAINFEPREVLHWRDDYMLIYDEPSAISALQPDFNLLMQTHARAIIATSLGDGNYDFISRFFAPKSGVNEDPITGSAHCIMAPYWAKVLNKRKLVARQLSPRGGEMVCELSGDRVLLLGEAKLYMKGRIYI